MPKWQTYFYHPSTVTLPYFQHLRGKNQCDPVTDVCDVLDCLSATSVSHASLLLRFFLTHCICRLASAFYTTIHHCLRSVAASRVPDEIDTVLIPHRLRLSLGCISTLQTEPLICILVERHLRGERRIIVGFGSRYLQFR